MSFSGTVKEEMAKHYSAARHCQIAELAALLHFCGQYGIASDGTMTIGFQTENESVVRKGFTLLKKAYNIENGVALSEEQSGGLFQKIGPLEEPVGGLLLRQNCCRRAFLRGAYLSVGSMSDPSKGYHLEFDCDDARKAAQLQEVMSSFGIESRMIQRKKYFVVYLKEGSAISDLLNVCEAPIALMDFENRRILREIGNSINRRVNCETANIMKTVNAASRQVEDIRFLQENYGLENLPENLREMALIRLEYPDLPLKDLGELFPVPIGKSGVNHRLRKLSELADKVRNT